MSRREPESVDVLVMGGGNAGLCAALAASDAGADVLLLEKGAAHERGANSRHTRNLRCAHAVPDAILRDTYTEAAYLQDLLRVTQGDTNEDLARLMIRESVDIRGWLEEHGVRFQPALSGTLSLAHSNAFFLGGGKALMNTLYRTAAERGVQIRYESEAIAFDLSARNLHQVEVRSGSARYAVRPGAVVLAAGGPPGRWRLDA